MMESTHSQVFVAATVVAIGVLFSMRNKIGFPFSINKPAKKLKPLQICVFCGSRPGSNPIYAEAATKLSLELARRNIGLVYGGGSVGLMGTVSTTVDRNGGSVQGVVPEALSSFEVSSDGVQQHNTIITTTMHERKSTMAQLSDGFIALPGGFGTLEELFEVITWTQLGIHQKPVGVLNVGGFYDPLVSLVNKGVKEGFIREAALSILVVESDPALLVDKLLKQRSKLPEGLTSKWNKRDP